MPESLLVIGGGYIGLEMGSVYAELGSKVSVVELTPTLLPGADRDLVNPLQAKLTKAFAAIHLETKVTSLSDKGNEIEVGLESAAGSRTERFSRVLVSVGRRPNSAGLGLENTQVEIDRKGFVVVDDQMRTADPHILAIGDVAGEPMLAHKATHQGRVAIEALLGEPAVFEPHAIPAVVFTDPEVAWAGLTEEQAKAEGVQIEVVRYPWAASGRAQALGRTEGFTKLLDRSGDGAGAGNRPGRHQRRRHDLPKGCWRSRWGPRARDIAETIHPHPTLSETVMNAAEVFFGTATEIYRPKSSQHTSG